MTSADTRERLHRIVNCCDETYAVLQEIKEKISQIIAYKQSSSGDMLMRNKFIQDKKAIEHLVTVGKNLDNAINDVQKLTQEVNQLLLGYGLAQKTSIGLGMGTGSTNEQNKDDDFAGGNGSND